MSRIGKKPVQMPQGVTATVSGQTVAINAEHPQGPLDLRLTFVADDFTGSWQLGSDGGELTGKRKRTP